VNRLPEQYNMAYLDLHPGPWQVNKELAKE